MRMDSSSNAHDDTRGEGSHGAPHTGKEAKVAAFCGEFLGLLLGATATVAVASVQGVVFLLDLSRKAILRNCYQGTASQDVEPVSYYVASQPVPAYTAAAPAPAQRIVVPRAPSGVRRVSSSSPACISCLAPSPSNTTSRPLAFCKPSGGVPCFSSRGSLLISSSVQQLCPRPQGGRGSGGVYMGRGSWRGEYLLVRCLDSSKGSNVSGFPSCLKVSTEEVRGVARSLAFWLRPRAAVAAVQGVTPAEDQHLISSVSEDLAFAWAALSEVGEVHATASQTRSQGGPTPLPFAALREDVPRLFWQPSKDSNDNLHLPPWNADACECQQSVSTAEGGASPLPTPGGPPSSQRPPFFFGRYLAVSGFSPSSRPQAPNG
ncbi:hypothetical protein Esti_000033 [Eimeria stiedai]